jgi:hypothetical protein
VIFLCLALADAITAARFSIVYLQCKIAIPDGHLYKLRFQFRIPRGIRALIVQNGKPKVSRFVSKSHRLPQPGVA